MTAVRLGAVGYLNARPLVYGLDRPARFQLQFDVPARCARLLEDRRIDLGLIPSIEYLRDAGYVGVPGVAIASRGAVASVALYTTRPIGDVRSIVMDTSSRTSVALVRVLCERLFKVRPAIDSHAPDLGAMLERADAALVIGDNALLWDGTRGGGRSIEKIDLGLAWTTLTGLPFVWAFWVGRAGAVGSEDVRALSQARDEGVRHSAEIARAYFADRPEHQETGIRYLRDNIKYHFGPEELAGLETFYRYAAELGLAARSGPVRFYQ